MTHLAEGFGRQFTDLLGPRTAKAAVGPHKVKNRTSIDYMKSIAFWFRARELDALYEANPALDCDRA